MEDKDLEMEDYGTMIITLEDGKEMECYVLEIFEVDEMEYIALLPVEDEEGEVLLYRFKEINEEDVEINMIETDEEFEKVAEAFNLLMDEYEDCDGEGHEHHHHHDGSCCCEEHVHEFHEKEECDCNHEPHHHHHHHDGNCCCEEHVHEFHHEKDCGCE